MSYGEEEWRHGICGRGDCGTCMGAWCCSCFVFGKTADRLDKFPSTSEGDIGMCNSACGMMCLAGCCHLHWLPLWFKRQEVRKKFNIKGNGCTDCLASYFCFCCSIAQMETELKDRAETAQRSGYGKNGGYVAQQQPMLYQPGM